MKRRASGGPKKQKVQVNKATNPAPRVEVTKRTKRVKKGPQAATLVQRTLEYIASNAHVVFSRTNQKAQSGLQTVIRDVLTSWDSPRRASITGLPRLIETLFPFVTVLDLSDAHLNFSSLALCTRLVSVNLKNTSVGDAAVTSLLESNPNLQVLNLSSCRQLTNTGIIKALCGPVPDLVSLKLNGNTELEGRALRQIIHRCPNLEHLGLSYCGKLCSVDLEKLTGQVLNFVDFSHRHRLQNLTSLNVSGFQHTTGIIGTICACSKLNSLDLSHTDLNDRLLYRIIQGCKGLTRLRLDYAGNISKKVLMDLPPIVPNIIDLGLSGQLCVDDFVVDQITSYCIGIQKLDVSYTLFSGHFFITKTQNHLTSLIVNGCVNIPTNEQFLQRMKAACPKLVRFQALNLDPLRQEAIEDIEDNADEEEDNE